MKNEVQVHWSLVNSLSVVAALLGPCVAPATGSESTANSPASLRWTREAIAKDPGQYLGWVDQELATAIDRKQARLTWMRKETERKRVASTSAVTTKPATQPVTTREAAFAELQNSATVAAALLVQWQSRRDDVVAARQLYLTDPNNDELPQQIAAAFRTIASIHQDPDFREPPKNGPTSPSLLPDRPSELPAPEKQETKESETEPPVKAPQVVIEYERRSPGDLRQRPELPLRQPDSPAKKVDVTRPQRTQNPPRVDDVFEHETARAEMALNGGQYDEAIAIYRAVLRTDRQSKTAEAGLASVLDRMHRQAISIQTSDPSRARSLLLATAAQGYAPAEHTVGAMCQSGKVFPKNLSEALTWYRRAAEHGLPRAQNALGCMLYAGEGTPADHAEGIRWMRKAAQQGDAHARLNLQRLRLSW